jgi:hypothetical protein
LYAKFLTPLVYYISQAVWCELYVAASEVKPLCMVEIRLMLLSDSLAALFAACAVIPWPFGEGPVSAVEAFELRPAQQRGSPSRHAAD